MLQYVHLHSSYFFVPFAVETSGVLGKAAKEFKGGLGRCLCGTTGDPHSRKYFLQCILVAVQRGNAAAVLDATAVSDMHNLYIFAHCSLCF